MVPCTALRSSKAVAGVLATCYVADDLRVGIHGGTLAEQRELASEKCRC